MHNSNWPFKFLLRYFGAIFWILMNSLQGPLIFGWMILNVTFVFLLVPFFGRKIGPLWIRRVCIPGMLLVCGIRVRITNKHMIDCTRPAVYIMNHLSNFDIPVILYSIPTDLRFIAKKSLLYVPFLGAYMWLAEMIFVNRKNPKSAQLSLLQAQQTLKEGKSILSFPEGTRSKNGSLLPFRRGPSLLAISAQVPIIPMAIVGTNRVLPAGSLRLRPQKVTLTLGAPIPTDGLTKNDSTELTRRCEQEVRSLLNPGI